MWSVAAWPLLEPISRYPVTCAGLCGLVEGWVPVDASSGCPVIDWAVETRRWGAGWWPWWWLGGDMPHRPVSQIRAPSGGLSRTSGSYDKTTRTAICFEHKTQYILIRAPCTRIVVQRPVTRSFDVFFDLHLNKWLSKQWWGWWFETPSPPLWLHCNGLQTHTWCMWYPIMKCWNTRILIVWPFLKKSFSAVCPKKYAQDWCFVAFGCMVTA